MMNVEMCGFNENRFEVKLITEATQIALSSSIFYFIIISATL